MASTVLISSWKVERRRQMFTDNCFCFLGLNRIQRYLEPHIVFSGTRKREAGDTWRKFTFDSDNWMAPGKNHVTAISTEIFKYVRIHPNFASRPVWCEKMFLCCFSLKAGVKDLTNRRKVLSPSTISHICLLSDRSPALAQFLTGSQTSSGIDQVTDCATPIDSKERWLPSSETQGQIVGRAGNWGERKRQRRGRGQGEKEKGLFSPLLLDWK